tara:strand:+ start:187 stop:549 length:363 start_codon:yes stop_codon:yes gene_type:complete
MAHYTYNDGYIVAILDMDLTLDVSIDVEETYGHYERTDTRIDGIDAANIRPCEVAIKRDCDDKHPPTVWCMEDDLSQPRLGSRLGWKHWFNYFNDMDMFKLWEGIENENEFTQEIEDATS